MINKLLLIGGGLAAAGIGTGFWIYYAINKEGSQAEKGRDGEKQGPKGESQGKNQASKGPESAINIGSSESNRSAEAREAGVAGAK